MAAHVTKPDPTRRWTAREVQSLPADGNRYEVVDGELLVTPSPRAMHQAVIGKLYLALGNYLTTLGRELTLFMGPADISWADDNLVQPDLLVVHPDELSPSWTTFRTLLLAVEVLSPSSNRHDRITKRRLYQRQQVASYWIVDSEARLVEVWHPADERPEIVTDTLVWRAERDAPPLEIDVDRLTAPL
jgi:Uma2 family endonuclease